MTKAISQDVENEETATFSPFARNDKEGIVSHPHEGEGWGEGEKKE